MKSLHPFFTPGTPVGLFLASEAVVLSSWWVARRGTWARLEGFAEDFQGENPFLVNLAHVAALQASDEFGIGPHRPSLEKVAASIAWPTLATPLHEALAALPQFATERVRLRLPFYGSTVLSGNYREMPGHRLPPGWALIEGHDERCEKRWRAGKLSEDEMLVNMAQVDCIFVARCRPWVEDTG